ncbi:flagellar biosynthetic protein FliO [Ectopseudomonas alcaliphila]|uniref:Flagellar protein n=1 Tax=Ectopseudomonas alcaliphila TaxID=101564 RepID=A0A1G7L635_9GAMM|nr:flagellar biosynthetic protein FliO [Pseudomonas alcaliphila]MDX5995190.1 flagellar biosynthetic protein FliO [Pseudomonas alcaliphila]SDF44987.1 flagellar protein FliO/FliZ [Pseudomonas alcaliphila]
MARLLVLFLSMPLAAMAAEPTGKAATPMAGSDIAGQLGQLLLGLLLVIGLIFLLAWLLRRMQKLAPRGGQVIKLLSTQALGPRDRLVLVQVGNEQILLGLSAGRITPLHVLKEPVHLGDVEQATPEFAQRLMELMGKDQKDKS